MLILRTQNAQVGVLRLRGLELRLGLHQIFVGIDAGLRKLPRQRHRVFIGLYRFVQKLLLGVLSANFEVVHGDFRLCRQPYVLQVRRGGLRGRDIRAHRISNAAPQVRRP